MAEPRRPRVIRSRPGAAPEHAVESGAKMPPARAVAEETASTGNAISTENGKQSLRNRKRSKRGEEPKKVNSPAVTPSGNDASAGAVGAASSTIRVTSGKVTLMPVHVLDEVHPESPLSSESDVPESANSLSASAESAAPESVTTRSSTFTKGLLGHLAWSSRASKARAKNEAKPHSVAAAPIQDSIHGNGSGATVLEFPIRARRRLRRGVWIWTGAVVAVLALVMATALFSPALAVKTITFDGRKLVPENALQSALKPIINRPLPQVTQTDVGALLASVPQVKSFWIQAVPPSTLLVHVVERVPVALLKNADSYLLVDKDGVQLGTTDKPDSVPLPLINGGKDAIGEDTFKAMTAVLATLPASVLSKLASASAKSPDAVELQLIDGKTVVWGNATDMNLKAQVLGALLAAPPPVPERGKPAPGPVQVYDVSAPRHPVTR
ncbi:cell division protein FtsQ/DivIB [Arthrobacter cryoconiti]|uniref:Cell division protein FtsQ/DivIB n=1 Tax=Arthrobacter cryoconiti TaxID=748907 RepID=A0ABV8R1G5_9MICC|nr:cell division protein FtsQ/DivIB [Arthrobacter cryoconiti]MCC9069102.1 cell division protein FtsQ/DivIB [Arthrobacter cryoconiti]